MAAFVKPVIAGNWKMHKGPRDSGVLPRSFELREATRRTGRPLLPRRLAAPSGLPADRPPLGVQNIHWNARAFTGEISPAWPATRGRDSHSSDTPSAGTLR